MAKATKGGKGSGSGAKVGAGLPGFGSSKGSTMRIWEGGEFLLEIEEVTESAKKEGNGVSVRVNSVCIGGPEQSDETDPKGKKINIFINVDPDKDFTIDQLADLFIAADVKRAGDQPPYAKLAGKQVVARLWKRSADNGRDYQGCAFIPKARSKAFGSTASADEDDD